EVMAERGADTLRYGPLKPVGLTNAHNPNEKPYAVIQLRQDNALGTLWNMVGFQTKLKYAEQVRVFRMIPGLERAEFARLGGLHRNTFLNSPIVLDQTLRLKARPSLRFAGQVTGVEGYVESAAIGLIAGRFAAADRMDRPVAPPPPTTALGALLSHITGGHLSVESESGSRSFQPMNVNFGLFPPITVPRQPKTKEPRPDGRRQTKALARKNALSARALADLETWLGAARAVAAE
ncbi:MAG: methylenetetrahydrofolate--tRNA-(uracil(54)-C(5))-methyltransferase (FADH(2)-oxidizing) TrmFO, partial [Methyloceanibacter sp.]